MQIKTKFNNNNNNNVKPLQA